MISQNQRETEKEEHIMKKHPVSKRCLALILAIAVFVISAFVLRASLTGGFSVCVQNVNFVTDEGVNLSATLWVPKNATAETPAAGIVIAPGGNTPHVFYASYSIELARRGYVVLAYDYYGTVGSGMTTQGNSGALAAMKYLSGLSFVDSSRLGSTGHSNGGGQASAAILSEYAASAEKRSVVFVGCGVPATDPTIYDGVNVMAIWGELDECGQGTFWDVYHEDSLNYGGMATLVGEETNHMEVGHYYGSPDDGSLRVLYTPNTFHSMSNLVPSSVTNIIRFFDDTLGGNTSTLADNSFVYVWQEFAVLFMAISLCVMIFPVGAMLLDTKLFSGLKREVPAATAKSDLKFWVFLLLPGILSALIVKSTVIQGQTIMGKLPWLFNVQSTNGFIWWFFLSALIGVVFYVIRSFVDKTIDRQADKLRARTSVANIALAVVFSLAVIAVPYGFAVAAERLTGWYGRIFQTYLAPLSAGRVGQYAVYYVLFMILFSVYAFLQADGVRLKGVSDRTNYWITLLVNALPAVLFLGTLYGKLILTHVTPINGREMSRAQGAMMGMLLLYFVVAKVVNSFYKKTGNIYVVSAVNAAFITWLSVNTPQLMI